MDAYNLFKQTERTGYAYSLWPGLPDDVIEKKSRKENLAENARFSSIDNNRRISDFLNKLTLSEKFIIYLKSIGYEYSEIPEILGLTKSRFYSHYRRIRKLRKMANARGNRKNLVAILRIKLIILFPKKLCFFRKNNIKQLKGN